MGVIRILMLSTSPALELDSEARCGRETEYNWEPLGSYASDRSKWPKRSFIGFCWRSRDGIGN